MTTLCKLLWQITKQNTLHPSFQGVQYAGCTLNFSIYISCPLLCMSVFWFILPWTYLEGFHILSFRLTSFSNLLSLLLTPGGFCSSPRCVSISVSSSNTFYLLTFLIHLTALLCTSKAFCFSDVRDHRLSCISFFLWFILFPCFVGMTSPLWHRRPNSLYCMQ